MIGRSVGGHCDGPQVSEHGCLTDYGIPLPPIMLIILRICLSYSWRWGIEVQICSELVI